MLKNLGKYNIPQNSLFKMPQGSQVSKLAIMASSTLL
jgi:hypothetical protein